MPSWLSKHTNPELELAREIFSDGIQPMLILRAICILSRENHRLLEICVQDCRREGMNWAEIGDAMGISRQAARRRFMHLDGDGGD